MVWPLDAGVPEVCHHQSVACMVLTVASEHALVSHAHRKPVCPDGVTLRLCMPSWQRLYTALPLLPVISLGYAACDGCIKAASQLPGHMKSLHVVAV